MCLIRYLSQIPLFDRVPRPGFRPGGRPTFSLAREKVGKERALEYQPHNLYVEGAEVERPT